MSCCPLLNLKFQNIGKLKEQGDRGTLIKICNTSDHPVLFPFDQGFTAYLPGPGGEITGSLQIAPGCRMIWVNNPDSPGSVPANTDDLIITTPSRLGDMWVEIVVSNWLFDPDVWEMFVEASNTWSPVPEGIQSGTFIIRALVDPHLYDGRGDNTGSANLAGLTEYLGWGDGIEQLSYLGVQGLRSVPNYLPANIKSLAHAFDGALNFQDKNVEQWDVSNVEDFSYVFNRTAKLAADLNGWDVGNGTDFSYAFAQHFQNNILLEDWRPVNAVSIEGIFKASGRFNQDLSQWDMPLLEFADEALYSAKGFNHDLSSWCNPLITTEPTGFSFGTTKWTLPKPNWGVPC